jgi:hypothetical protein
MPISLYSPFELIKLKLAKISSISRIDFSFLWIVKRAMLLTGLINALLHELLADPTGKVRLL